MNTWKNIFCNSLIPAKILQICSTAFVDQSKMVMRVYEGYTKGRRPFQKMMIFEVYFGYIALQLVIGT